MAHAAAAKQAKLADCKSESGAPVNKPAITINPLPPLTITAA